MALPETRDAACLTKLQELGILSEVHSHPVVTNIAEWTEQLDKLPVGTRLAKNMFLKGKKGELVLVFALAETKTDLKAVSAAVKVAGGGLRFASEEVLHGTLGVVQGGVTPLALVNDEKKSVTVVLDKAVLNASAPLAVHPCRNDQTVCITAADLLIFFAALGYTPVEVDFSAVSVAAPVVAPVKGAAKGEKHAEAVVAKAPKAKAKKVEDGECALGIDVPKMHNFPEWYQQVIRKSEMLEFYDVSGCYILRPWSFEIWEQIKSFLDKQIKMIGVENCYFPMFVTKSALEQEQNHVDGFSAEVAWVGKAGDDEMENPIAIRPTSETVMYPAYAKWIRSHRDLPLRLNQWCNVVRWEFSHPTPFIRTREFLWQEGHSAFASKEEADIEVRAVLDIYRRVYEDLLACPTVPGTKTEKEKFAGGDYTTTVETFIPAVGRGCQGATSHHLGQNFGKMFNIRYEDPKGGKEHLYPYQNSWGMTTRTIGVMIMVHGDDKGLVLPPRVASLQVVVVPVGITAKLSEDEKATVYSGANSLCMSLMEADVRAKADVRDNYNAGWKFNHWELKGVPLRVELGPNELAKKELKVVKRHSGATVTIPFNANVAASFKALLDTVHDEMFAKQKVARAAGMAIIKSWVDFVPNLNERKTIMAPWCGSMACEDAIKNLSAEESKTMQEGAREDERAPSMGAKSLCIPFEQPELPEGTMCIARDCNCKADKWVLWGRSF